MKTLTISVPDDVYNIAKRRAAATRDGFRTAEQVVAAAAEMQLRELDDLGSRISAATRAVDAANANS